MEKLLVVAPRGSPARCYLWTQVCGAVEGGVISVVSFTGVPVPLHHDWRCGADRARALFLRAYVLGQCQHAGQLLGSLANYTRAPKAT